MNIDVHTAGLIAMLACLSQTVILSCIRMVRREPPIVNWWLGSAVCVLITLTLMQFRSNDWVADTDGPPLRVTLTVLLPICFVAASSFCFVAGVRSFTGRTPIHKPFLALSLLLCAEHFWFTFLSPDYFVRTIVLTGYLTLMSLWSAWMLFRQPDPAVRISCTFCGLVCAINGTGTALRVAALAAVALKGPAEHTVIASAVPLFLSTALDRTFLTVALLFMLYQREVAAMAKYHQHELEREKSMTRLEHQLELSQNLHDGMGSAIAAISLVSDAGRREASPERRSAAFEEISRLARETGKEIRTLIDHLDDPECSRATWLRDWKAHVTGITQQLGIQLHWQDSGFDHLPVGSPLAASTLTRALKECIHNAVRHSGAAMLTIRAHAGPQSLEICITDDGCGFDGAQRPGGRGLTGIRKRARQLGGEVTITPSPGVSIAWSLPLPLRMLSDTEAAPSPGADPADG